MLDWIDTAYKYFHDAQQKAQELAEAVKQGVLFGALGAVSPKLKKKAENTVKATEDVAKTVAKSITTNAGKVFHALTEPVNNLPLYNVPIPKLVIPPVPQISKAVKQAEQTAKETIRAVVSDVGTKVSKLTTDWLRDIALVVILGLIIWYVLRGG